MIRIPRLTRKNAKATASSRRNRSAILLLSGIKRLQSFKAPARAGRERVLGRFVEQLDREIALPRQVVGLRQPFHRGLVCGIALQDVQEGQLSVGVFFLRGVSHTLKDVRRSVAAVLLVKGVSGGERLFIFFPREKKKSGAGKVLARPLPPPQQKGN